MCGLTGFMQSDWAGSAQQLEDTVKSMSGALVHRGPDDSGCWLDVERGLALGHRRLAVIDLSEHGHQPMLSASQRYVLAYNGEIYNHLQLREQLGAVPWRGGSDTETLLAAIERWGVEGAVQRSSGMFALALWDRQTRRLVLARDRLGEKPLYYGWFRGTFLFASELHALRAYPGFDAPVDPVALAGLLRQGVVPSPLSIHVGIRKLPPGTLVHLPHGAQPGTMPEPVPYWSFHQQAVAGLSQPFEGSDDDATDVLEARLGGAVQAQMIADVPVGAFLSGGIDSSVVVALMQRAARQPVKTFTIGFDAPEYDESVHARAVARHLGTDHTELRLSDTDVRDALPVVVETFDEPFGDSSAIPAFLVARLARTRVTVSLSGDGGDELFCGYTRYAKAARHWRRLSAWPLPLRQAAALLLSVGPARARDAAALFAAAGADTFYREMISQWRSPQRVVRGLSGEWRAAPLAETLRANMLNAAMCIDSSTYLPDDILTKVDRSAMRNSLETRVPMLDHELVQWVWTLPQTMKVRDGQSKWLLRRVLERHVPRALFERPKVGFAVPLDEWLRTGLRPWAEELLSEERLRREGHFDPAPIRRAWQAHVEGRAQLRDVLWPVLMFQAWQQRLYTPAR